MTEQTNAALNLRRLTAGPARTDDDVEGALRLRYQVFAEEEKNLRLYNPEGLETDRYDEYCDHLVVKDEDSGQVVGTYRLLPGPRAALHGGFYSESEFDLAGYRPWMRETLELGRSCVHPDYRSGRAIRLLWEEILHYADNGGFSRLVGCASVHSRTRDEMLETYSLLHKRGVITARYGIRPLDTHTIPDLAPVELTASEEELFRRLPPLVKGYQWLGAEIGGEPAYDALFGTVDYFVILEKARISRRYLRLLQGGV
ncbi:GNAT family N-acetyltransferase [Paenibacillus mesotrionivorans]|uniref:GNAT family N-acetyltransferase n=1 Tax=Paenibacillus mesotrionivorans TaxID=3160968 RepID=A0ACC7NZN8_9BACL